MKNFFGGTQTWTMTVAEEFFKQGHEVVISAYEPECNVLFKKFFKDYELLKPNYFDLVIINGNKNIKKFSEYAKKSIFISHGILPSLEQPLPGADYYFGVSEETENNIKAKGYKSSGILRNAIDTDKFYYTEISTELKTIAFLDRRRHFPYIDEIKKYYIVIEIGNPPTNNMPKALHSADLVVARGRGIYEAMSMGKNVIVSGNNSGRSKEIEIMDGFVDSKTFFEFRKNNCSGRNQNIKVESANQFLKELKKYDKKQGLKNRDLILQNNKASLIVNELIKK